MKEQQESLIQWGKYAFVQGLAWGRSGNLSCRTREASILITASGSSLGYLTSDDIVVFRMDTGEARGTRKPSIEAEMHRRIYLVRSDVGAVFHAQPLYATIIACTAEPIDINLIPESIAYLTRPARIPYSHPGSEELAARTAEAAMDTNIVILENHGLVSLGGDLEEAIINAETFEFFCRIYLGARSACLSLRWLKEDQAKDFIAHLEKMGTYGREKRP